MQYQTTPRLTGKVTGANREQLIFTARVIAEQYFGHKEVDIQLTNEVSESPMRVTDDSNVVIEQFIFGATFTAIPTTDASAGDNAPPPSGLNVADLHLSDLTSAA